MIMNFFTLKDSEENIFDDYINKLYYHVKYINIIKVLEVTLFAPYLQEIHCQEHLSPRNRECSEVLFCHTSIIIHTDSMV